MRWLSYSGGEITVILNPCHWVLVPVCKIRKPYLDEFYLSERYRELFIKFLCVRVRIWFDNGTEDDYLFG